MYYGADGAMLHGTQVIGGQTYRFDSVTGALLLNGMELKAQIYNSNTGWLILVDTSANRVGVYRGYVNNWNEVKYWPCTSGAMSTPTVKGGVYGSRTRNLFWLRIYMLVLYTILR